MPLNPICRFSVACWDRRCKDRHPFYTDVDMRQEIRVIIEENGGFAILKPFTDKSHYRNPFKWCYDGVFCCDRDKCPYNHIYTKEGNELVRMWCKQKPNILVPVN